MANNVIKRVWNQNGMVAIEDLQGSAFSAESGGHTFRISGVDSEDNLLPLSGSVAASFLRPDQATVAISGSVSGGVVSVTLPANCYDVPGRFGLVIFLTSNGQKTAIYSCVGNVARSSTSTVAPQTTADVVDLINRINAAVATIPASYTDLMAAAAPTYSASALYPVGSYVWYDGKLYKSISPITTAESWTAAHWTLANLGDDVRDLKSALGTEPIIPITWEQGRLSVQGMAVDSNYAIRSKDFIPADSNHRILWLLAGEYPLPEGANGLHIVIYEYSSTSPETLVKYTDKSMAGKSQTLTFDSTTVAFKAAINYTPAATYVISPNVGNLISVMWNSDALPRIVYNTNKTANDAYDGLVYGSPSYLDWEQGRLSVQGAEVDSTTLCRTKLVPVSAGNVLEIVQAPTHGVDIFYYNGSTFVERVPVGGGSQAKFGTRFYTVPTGVNGVRITCGIDGIQPITPDVAEKMVFMAISDRAFLEILHGAENGVHRIAKMRSFGNSILTGTVYPDGSIGHIVAFDNTPYGGIATGLGIAQRNVEHTLLSSTGLLYDAGKGSFLSNIKRASLANYDYLTTHLWIDDMSNFPLGSIEDSVADDGTIVGGVLSLLNYIRSNNALCNLVLVSVPPVGISSAGSGVFDAVYANGHSIRELDDVMHKLADIYHFIYIDWQDMYLSYHYQEYTYQANNVHLASDAPYRTMAEYLSRKVKMNDYKSPIWVNGICVGAEWEQGRVSTTGNLIDATTAIRTKKIPLENKSALYINAPLSYIGACYYYNKQTFVSYENILGLPKYSSVPNNANSVIVAIRKNDLSDILPKSGEDVSILDKDGTIMDAVISKGEPRYGIPLLTIIDDDSNERFYNDLYQVMKNKNVSIATAVITGSVGNPGQMSWDEIRECSANGMEILSHTNRHFLSTDADFDTLTIRDITIDYQKAKNILALHGVPSDILVFSGSTGLTQKFQTAAKRVYKAGILAGDNRTNFQGGDPYGIRRYRVGNQTNYHCDIDVLKGLVDSVKNTGGWMIWMTHTSGGADAWTPGTGEGSSAYILGQAVDYAISNGVPVVTAEYGFTQYFSNFQNMDVQPYQ